MIETLIGIQLKHHARVYVQSCGHQGRDAHFIKHFTGLLEQRIDCKLLVKLLIRQIFGLLESIPAVVIKVLEHFLSRSGASLFGSVAALFLIIFVVNDIDVVIYIIDTPSNRSTNLVSLVIHVFDPMAVNIGVSSDRFPGPEPLRF